MYNKKIISAALSMCLVFLCSCGVENSKQLEGTTMQSKTTIETATQIEENLAWQQSVKAVTGENVTAARCEGNTRNWYEVFVYSFNDSNGDGIGDLNGVTEMLDYISYMGFNGIWLMPIHPSPTYHKYDITDYYGIDQQYGTMEDFERLVNECEKRGISLILDLVINHTSSIHPWFLEAQKAIASGEMDNEKISFYNFSDEAGNGNWKKSAGDLYYECQFWDKMPDLNLENESLRAELSDVMKFWLEKGVSGFRLDATIEYVTGNQAKNIEILTWINKTIKQINPDAYIVGEAWDATAGLYELYKSGVDGFFNFNFAMADGKLAKSVLLKNQSAKAYAQQLVFAQQSILSENENAFDAPFFTNHDTARAAGFLRQDERLIKLAWGMNLFQSGNSFLYYGEELGMSGSGDDPSKRLPMFWTDDSMEKGMTFLPPGSTDMKHKFGTVVEQLTEQSSILNYIRSANKLKEKYPQISNGIVSLADENIVVSNEKICVLYKEYKDKTLTLVYNIGAEDGTVIIDGDVADGLYTGDDVAVRDGDKIKIPAYSIIILDGEGTV